ncbi:penicillin acylase family protein [Nocardioides ferulae]|uniref:penicillin acylase family protein n=1 Tax=Nocardioides ferulae TaxID=2340821 RepID=UPI000EB5817F|nr:penicillin acylase family protein [Nocardioides ferulae]
MTDRPATPQPTAAAPAGAVRERVRAAWTAFRTWPRALRGTAYAAVGLVLVLIAALATGVVLVRRPLPQTTGSATLPGLESDVEVVRDAHGIPQLYGDSIEDLMRAQGWVQASERFFEMDVRRHATAGRLAELVGEDAVDSDRLVRTMGWRRVAEEELALVQPQTRAALEAYADGVNAYLDQRSPSELAVEYTLLNLGGLGYRPERWTPVDSLSWLKAMAWDLSGNLTEEVDRALATAAVGARRAGQLDPAHVEQMPAVGQGVVVDGVFEPEATTGGTRNPQRPGWGAPRTDVLAGVGRALDRMPAWLGRGEGVGSNAWVVSGEHTDSGAPLLANDPHLGVGLPSAWMQMGLHCREVDDDCPLDVAGFTFAGVPGVLIGRNADIAWGMTNLGADVADLYVEQVAGEQWLRDGRLRPLRTRTETIRVADGDDVTFTVRETAHGPLISDAADRYEDVALAAEGSGPGQPDTEPDPEPDTATEAELAVALAWTALEPQPTADAILGLDLATDWDSFRAAAASFAVPGQNLVYADREGHIGYQATGRVPVRKSGNDGTVPARGWRPEDDWAGETVPFDGLPQVLDPEEGFLVTANQAAVGPDYPYALTRDWDRGYRAQRIHRILAQLVHEGSTVSVEEMLALQLDDENLLAPVLVPHLLEVELPAGYDSDGQELLADWDFGQPADSAAAAYFNVVWRHLLELTFHDELPEAAWPDGGQRWYAVVTDLLDRPHDAWWDDVTTADVESRDHVLVEAQLLARDELTRTQARRAEDWTWGRLHVLDLRSSALGDPGSAVEEWLLNRGAWRLGGGASTVQATGWDAAVGYRVTTAPAMRMLVDLDDLDSSRWINLGGVSGHPASAHYTDQTDLWADGETLPWAFTRPAVEAAGEDVLTLEPAPEE